MYYTLKQINMKKILLGLIIGLFFTFTSHAQSLVIKDKDGIVVTGQTLEVLCTPGVGVGSLGLDVYNVSDQRKSVKVRKIENYLIAESEVTFCWASCYPPFVFESPDPIMIEAGSFTPNFTGDVGYGSTQGTVSATFVFFDMDNAVDSSYVTINFVVGTLGVPVNSISVSSLSNAYPNPAATSLNFDYKLASANDNARIRINNLLGTAVRDIPLEKAEGKVTLDVTNLKNGIYFYSLITNNSTTITRKFVVKR
jgi:hypothetical protein